MHSKVLLWNACYTTLPRRISWKCVVWLKRFLSFAMDPLAKIWVRYSPVSSCICSYPFHCLGGMLMLCITKEYISGKRLFTRNDFVTMMREIMISYEVLNFHLLLIVVWVGLKVSQLRWDGNKIWRNCKDSLQQKWSNSFYQIKILCESSPTELPQVITWRRIFSITKILFASKSKVKSSCTIGKTSIRILLHCSHSWSCRRITLEDTRTHSEIGLV